MTRNKRSANLARIRLENSSFEDCLEILPIFTSETTLLVKEEI